MKLQFRDIDGNVTEEKELVLGVHDILIVKMKEKVNYNDTTGFVNAMKRMDEQTKIIFVPYWAELSIIRKESISDDL